MMPCLHMKNLRIDTSPNCLVCSSRKNGFIKSSPEPTQKEMKLRESSPTVVASENDQNLEAVEFRQILESNPVDLVWISNAVIKHQDKIIKLPNSDAASDLYLRICGLDGTIFSGETYMLESWKELYLPEPTEMIVLGILESTKGMAPFPQWIVLLGEDGHVYGFEDDTIHLIASSLKELIYQGIKNTGVYYDYPDDLSDEDEEVLLQDKELQKRRQKTREFIDKDADEFNKFLDLF